MNKFIFLVKYFLSFNDSVRFCALRKRFWLYTNERNDDGWSIFWRWMIGNIRSHSICYNVRLMIELLKNLMRTKILIINIYFGRSSFVQSSVQWRQKNYMPAQWTVHVFTLHWVFVISIGLCLPFKKQWTVKSNCLFHYIYREQC